jgi:hypothetical protein
VNAAPTGFLQHQRPVSELGHLASVLTHTHTYSGVWHHGGALPPPDNYTQLRAWCKRRNVRALGMGSPYTPLNAKHYGYCEHEGFDAYYGPGGLSESHGFGGMLDLPEVQAMLHAVNHDQAHTLFYQDNETPKTRFGHLWWVGYHYDKPAWHDYDQPFDRWMCNEQIPGSDADEPVPYQRRPYSQIFDAQHQHGSVGVWAHPTSWWRDRDGRFITNIAAEMPAHAYAHGRLDGMVVMGYHAFRPEYQALWFALLDQGYFVPGTAEMDMGLSDSKAQNDDPIRLSYVPCKNPTPTLNEIKHGFKSGSLLCSSGPLLSLTVDGKTSGQVAPATPGQVHKVTIRVESNPENPNSGGGPLGQLDLITRSGKIIHTQPHTPEGIYTFDVPCDGQKSYLIARVFGANDNPVDHKNVKLHAITNPVYLHPAGASFLKPGTTRLTINRVGLTSADNFQLQTADGGTIDSGSIRTNITIMAPANARIVFFSNEKPIATKYLINDNPAVMALMRHLYRGKFFQTHPHLSSGEVPVECWQLDKFPKAMANLTLDV